MDTKTRNALPISTTTTTTNKAVNRSRGSYKRCDLGVDVYTLFESPTNGIIPQGSILLVYGMQSSIIAKHLGSLKTKKKIKSITSHGHWNEFKDHTIPADVTCMVINTYWPTNAEQSLQVLVSTLYPNTPTKQKGAREYESFDTVFEKTINFPNTVIIISNEEQVKSTQMQMLKHKYAFERPVYSFGGGNKIRVLHFKRSH